MSELLRDLMIRTIGLVLMRVPGEDIVATGGALWSGMRILNFFVKVSGAVSGSVAGLI